MGLLDDLRNQAQSKKAADEEEAAKKADRERYYQETILPRMIRAYQFFNEFVDHLNYINLETIVNYPLLPDGRPQPLRQEGYKVVIDSSKALKRIDFAMEGVLDIPVEYEIYGRDAVHKHADRIERYSFRHTRKDKKDPTSMEVLSAKFTLLGPLPLKVTIEADINQSQVIVTIRNFNEPGFTKYNLTVEQFSDEFLDQIGKFVLRKEDRLFGKSEEISEDAKKKLRDRMIVEARIRQQELIEAEERRKVEEATEKERSAKEQIKRAVNTQVIKGKESLKDMMSKLKKQASSVLTPEPKQPPAQVQTAQPAPRQPALPEQAKPQTAKPPVMPAPANQQTVISAAPAVPPQKPVAAASPIEVAQKQHAPIPPAASVSAAPAPAAADPKSAEPQAANTPVTPAVKKKPQPPKIFTASPDNPFLKPEPVEETPASESEQVAENSVAKQDSPVASDVTAEDLERDLNRIIEREKPASKSQNPFLTPASAAAQTTQSSEIANSANPFLQTSKSKAAPTPALPPDKIEKPKPILKPGELSTDLSANLTIPREDKDAEETPQPEIEDPSQNPFLKSDQLDIDVAANAIPPQDDVDKENP